MGIVKLRDGSSIEVPEDLQPDELAWLKENQMPGALEDVGKSSLSGLTEGALRAPFVFGDLLNLGARGLNKLRPGTVPEEYEKLTSDRAVEIGEDATGLQRYKPATTPGRYANAAGAALGGTVALGPLGAFRSGATASRLPGAGPALKQLFESGLKTPALTAPIVGMAGQAGADLAGPAGGFAGAFGSQIAMSLIARGLTPNHPDWIREGTKAMKAEEWKQAFEQRSRLEQAGAKSATLADAMPENSQLRGFTRDLSNSTGASELVQKIAGRNSPGTQVMENGRLTYQNQGEIPRLLDEASEVVLPGGVNAGAVTDQVAGNAESVLQGARDARFQAYNPILQNAPMVPREDLVRQLLQLRAKARLPENLGTPDQKAYMAAVEKLRRTPTYPMPQGQSVPGASGMTQVGPQVSPAVGLPTQPPAGALPPPGQGLPGPVGAFLPGAPQGYPVGAAAPGAMPPRPPRVPMGVNLQALSKNVNDLKQGVPVPGMGLDKAAGYSAYRQAGEAVRSVSPEYDRAMNLYQQITQQSVNPLQQGLVGQLAKLKDLPPSERALPGVLQRSTPQELASTLPQVAPTADLRQQLARVIADQSKKPLGAAGPSAEATQRARQTVAGLIDPQAASTYSLKTGAADTLAKLTVEAGADPTVRQGLSRSTLAAMAAPFLEFRNKMRLKLSEQETTVLANLLSNPTEANMKLLQKIAQERPEAGQLMRSVQTLGRTGVAASAVNGE